jgi:uncharacterized membrane protein YkoI
MRNLAATIVIVLTTLIAWPDSGLADSHRRARDAVEAGEILPLGDVLGIVRGRYAGRVMDVDLKKGGGSWVYKVKLLTPDGQLKRISVDARTGRIK